MVLTVLTKPIQLFVTTVVNKSGVSITLHGRRLFKALMTFHA